MRNFEYLQLVTIKQAKKLKKIGFDWECDRYYALVTDYHNQWEKGRIYRNSCVNNVLEVASCPTVALALKWFRDIKNDNGEILCSVNGEKPRNMEFYFSINSFFKSNFVDCEDIRYETYEDAESACLDELLRLNH